MVVPALLATCCNTCPRLFSSISSLAITFTINPTHHFTIIHSIHPSQISIITILSFSCFHAPTRVPLDAPSIPQQLVAQLVPHLLASCYTPTIDPSPFQLCACGHQSILLCISRSSNEYRSVSECRTKDTFGLVHITFWKKTTSQTCQNSQEVMPCSNFARIQLWGKRSSNF